MRFEGQRAWRAAALLLLLPAWRSHGAEEDPGPAAVARRHRLRGQGSRRLTGQPQPNLTEQLEELECATAYFSCDCAARDGCRWLVYSGGVGGRCTDGEGGVSCSACDMQETCPGGRCSLKESECDCVGDDDCRWDAGSGTCEVGSTTIKQRCGACPTLAGCSEAFPQAVSLDPSSGGAVDGRYVRVTFSSGLGWCAGSGSPSLWCGSVAASQIVSRDHIALQSNVLRVDVSASLTASSTTLPAGGLTCGLVIPSDVLCSTSDDSAAFLGLSADADYSFSVFDTTGPAITGYFPQRPEVEGWVTLSFSEPVFKPGGAPGDAAVQATLGRLSMDWSGANTGQVISRAEVQAEIWEEAKLRVLLGGLVQPEFWYTLSIPAASLEDTAGNLFEGLLEGALSFRVAPEFAAQSVGQAEFAEASDGLSTGAVVGVVAAVSGLCSMACFWLRRRVSALEALQRVHGLRRAADPEVPAKVRVPKALATASLEGSAAAASSGLRGGAVTTPPPGVAWQHPCADDADMWARPSERHPGADASSRPGGGPPPAERASPRPRDERSWEDRSRRAPPEKGAPAAAAASQGQPPPRQPPTSGPAGGAKIGEPPRAQARQARQEARSASQPPPSGGSEPQQDPHQTTATCPPEAKAVESKLRNTMGAALEERKKVYKALLLEYHPDKNSDPGAKEVFQYVNGARDWYLHVPS